MSRSVQASQSVLQSEKVPQLLKALQSGCDLETAANFAGLPVNDVFRWIERGQREAESQSAGAKPKDSEASFLELWTELRKARAEAVIRNVAHVQQAASKGDWKAAAWWLERSVPEKFGKDQQ